MDGQRPTCLQWRKKKTNFSIFENKQCHSKNCMGSIQGDLKGSKFRGRCRNGLTVIENDWMMHVAGTLPREHVYKRVFSHNAAEREKNIFRVKKGKTYNTLE